jgi:predicted dehydrogenase
MSLPTAIIGCGLIGGRRALALGSGLRLVSTYDTNAARSQALASRCDAHPAVDADEAISLVGKGGLVIVATTHDQLVHVAMKAAQAGCHVLVEKPGARNRQELDRLAHLAEAKRVVVRVGYNHRFHPSVQELRHRLVNGSHGRLLTVRGRYGHGGRVGYESEWRADQGLSGGGELLDQGVHLIDLCQFLTGPVGLRYGAISTRYWDMRVEDNAFLHLRLADDADGWLHASWTEWKNLFSMEFSYAEAKFEISGLGGSYGPERLTEYRMGPSSRPPDIFVQEWPPQDGSWALEMLDVAAAIAGGTSQGADIWSTLALLDVVAAVYER